MLEVCWQIRQGSSSHRPYSAAWETEVNKQLLPDVLSAWSLEYKKDSSKRWKALLENFKEW